MAVATELYSVDCRLYTEQMLWACPGPETAEDPWLKLNQMFFKPESEHSNFNQFTQSVQESAELPRVVASSPGPAVCNHAQVARLLATTLLARD